MELSTAYDPQTNGQSEFANKAILQAARVCKVEGNEWLHKPFKIQLKLNFRDNTTKQYSSFLSIIGFEPKLGPSYFPYLSTPYTPAEERYLDTSTNLYSSKFKDAKQAHKKRSVLLLLSASQKVLLSMKNINLLNTFRKLNPRWLGLFRIQYVKKKRNNYILDLSMDS